MLFSGRSVGDIVVILVALIMGLVFHEFSHAYVAHKLGDDHFGHESRLTLNPLQHIDPMGFVFILLLGFGWAKPVRVNPNKFKRPILGEILVSLAGPAANFVIVFICFGVLKLVTVFLPDLDGDTFYIIFNFLILIASYNTMLGVFNLIPLPPLDGSHLYTSVIFKKNPVLAMKIQKYGFYTLMGLLLINNFTPINVLPISGGIDFVLRNIYNLFF